MGWNALRTGDQNRPSEFMTMQDLIQRFDLKDVPQRRAAMFGGKLQFLNKQHLSTKIEEGDKGVLERFRAMLDIHLFVDGFQFDDEYLRDVLMLIKVRLRQKCACTDQSFRIALATSTKLQSWATTSLSTLFTPPMTQNLLMNAQAVIR